MSDFKPQPRFTTTDLLPLGTRVKQESTSWLICLDTEISTRIHLGSRRLVFSTKDKTFGTTTREEAIRLWRSIVTQSFMMVQLPIPPGFHSGLGSEYAVVQVHSGKIP